MIGNSFGSKGERVICFLHTSNWQLGMTRHFLLGGVQEKYNQARFDAMRTMGRIAKEDRCQFMVVCGDAFESNQVNKTRGSLKFTMEDPAVPTCRDCVSSTVRNMTHFIYAR